MLKAVALAFKKMHSVNRQHGCCYVRHIYVKTEGKAEAGFLDLEKSRRRLRRDKAINHDFRQLEKYLEPIPKADWEQVKAAGYEFAILRIGKHITTLCNRCRPDKTYKRRIWR